MEQAGTTRHRSQNPRGEGERAGRERIKAFGVEARAQFFPTEPILVGGEKWGRVYIFDNWVRRVHAGTWRTLPFFQTTGDNPRFQFSERTFRATRRNARSARETNTGGFFAPFALRFLFISPIKRRAEFYIIGRRSRQPFCGQPAVVPNCPARRESQVIIY